MVKWSEVSPEFAQLYIKLYLDADVHKRLAEALRLRGFNAVSARELGFDELKDKAQLQFAVSQERALLTFNSVHFIELHKEYILAGKHHCGIIISDQIPFSEALRRVTTLLNTFIRTEIQDQLFWLQSFK